ncbi:MAG: cell division protein ZapD [Candidatus Competibacterales bacterium]
MEVSRDAVVFYEHPLNERMRTFLRLEALFTQFDATARGPSPWDSRAALQSLFEVMRLVGRNELKSELRQELERYSRTLGRLRQRLPDHVDTQRLDDTLEDLNHLALKVQNFDTIALESLRNNDFLGVIRQRSALAVGTFDFDLPALHHWLQYAPDERFQHLQGWFALFLPLREGIETVLHLVRQSAHPTLVQAPQGFYQQNLDTNTAYQLLRVSLDTTSSYYPEISGGRHRFAVRFMNQPDPNQKAVPVEETVEFGLVCCAL